MPFIPQPTGPMPSPYPGDVTAEAEKVGPVRVSAERVGSQSESVVDLALRLDRLHSRLHGFPALPPEQGELGEHPEKNGDIPQLGKAIDKMDAALSKLSEVISELEKL